MFVTNTLRAMIMAPADGVVPALRRLGVREQPVPAPNDPNAPPLDGYMNTTKQQMRSRINTVKRSFTQALEQLQLQRDATYAQQLANQAVANANAIAYNAGQQAGQQAAVQQGQVGPGLVTLAQVSWFIQNEADEDQLAILFSQAFGSGKYNFLFQ